MNDIALAAFVLQVAARADGGCVPCIQPCIDEAVHEHPELPWEDAVHAIRPRSSRPILTEAIRSARSSMPGSPQEKRLA